MCSEMSVLDRILRMTHHDHHLCIPSECVESADMMSVTPVTITLYGKGKIIQVGLI